MALEKIKESAEIDIMFNHICDEQLSICDALEEIADTLPKRIDKQVCIHTARILPQIIKRAHYFEDNILFPSLKRSKIMSIDLSVTIKRLTLEQAANEYFTEELSDVLLAYAIENPILEAEATGYMLRGFFEKLRQHVAFKKELFKGILNQK